MATAPGKTLSAEKIRGFARAVPKSRSTGFARRSSRSSVRFRNWPFHGAGAPRARPSPRRRSERGACPQPPARPSRNECSAIGRSAGRHKQRSSSELP